MQTPTFISTTPTTLTTTTFTPATFQQSTTTPATLLPNTPRRAAHHAPLLTTTTQPRMADALADKLAWVDAMPITDISPGSTTRVVLEGLDVCLACGYDGQVYALGNKSPPLGIPLSDGTVVETNNETYIKCSQYGTMFEVSTGEVLGGSWIASPFIISNLLRLIFQEPQPVAVYPVREANGNIEVLINVNARAQYEEKYWKGLLDASGKADGGYY